MEKLLKIVKNKVFIIVSLVILFVILLFTSCYLIIYSQIKLNGKSTINIIYGEEYTDLGAKLKIAGVDFSKRIKTTNKVDTTKVGSYKVVYKFNYLFLTIKKERTVNIIDNILPEITLEGEATKVVCPNKEYEEEGFKATDNYDGDITDKVVKEKNSDGNIVYLVKDSSGNEVSIIRYMEYKDEEKPKIVINGSSSMYVKKGLSYSDKGAEVTDNCDTDIKVSTSGSVDTSKEGTYYIKYTAKDISGNEVSETRKVVVYNESGTGMVYLTFDDGPGGSSTIKILDILKKYDVKATFFVTSKGSNDLIKREYDEGHTVALHTSTHDYGYLYKSVDNYFEDLQAVENRVYSITGTRPKIIRFPGGSNNTVSISASGYRIMDTLTKEVVNRGYSYYDWNVSSGDAGECSSSGSSSCVYNMVVNHLSKSRINIVLMHDIKMFTANALEDIIKYCINNGYVFRVIDESTPPIRFQ